MQFNARVESVRLKKSIENKEEWVVRIKMLRTKQEEEIIFSAVIICNGCVFFFFSIIKYIDDLYVQRFNFSFLFFYMQFLYNSDIISILMFQLYQEWKISRVP